MGDCPSGLVLRIGTPEDAKVIAELVGELAAYERLADSNRCTPEAIRAELRDSRRVLEVLLAVVKGEVVGLASFFTTYSTFAAKRGIYLEDIIVRPTWRHRGIGSSLMKELARIAHERDCGRMEWTTLLWNTPAIEFYESLNATPNEAWTTYRLTGDGLRKLAADAATATHDQA